MKKETIESENAIISRKNMVSKGFKFAILPSTFVLTAIIGFLVSAIYISSISKTWGFAFSMVFMMMFISSIISMSKATTEDHVLDHLAIHEPEKHLKHIRKKKN